MNQVQIIIADINHYEENEKLLEEIAPCYVDKCQKHKIAVDQKQELVSGLLLKEYLGITKNEQLIYNDCGKPEPVGKDKFFNLSHSGDYVVLAIADCEIGIDVEKIRKCHEATVKKVFHEDQKERLFELEGEAKDIAFSKMWTECEAILKLRGTGFGEGWEMALQEKYCLHTFEIEDFFVTCATEEQVDIKTIFMKNRKK